MWKFSSSFSLFTFIQFHFTSLSGFFFSFLFKFIGYWRRPLQYAIHIDCLLYANILYSNHSMIPTKRKKKHFEIISKIFSFLNLIWSVQRQTDQKCKIPTLLNVFCLQTKWRNMEWLWFIFLFFFILRSHTGLQFYARLKIIATTKRKRINKFRNPVLQITIRRNANKMRKKKHFNGPTKQNRTTEQEKSIIDWLTNLYTILYYNKEYVVLCKMTKRKQNQNGNYWILTKSF